MRWSPHFKNRAAAWLGRVFHGTAWELRSGACAAGTHHEPQITRAS